MATQSSIEWTQATWNPVTGCNKISPGCKHCYAERLSFRLREMGQKKYVDGFKLKLHPGSLSDPFRMKKPQLVFVNSMSDLFHHQIPAEFILKVFRTMEKANWHRYQILTKRSDRLLELDPRIKWLPNIWMGVSVEREDYCFRIDDLRRTHALTKFLSIEPLLGPIQNLDLKGMNWVIVGGESGPGARVMQKAWVTDLRDQCIAAGVPFFFKQWGGINKKAAGRILDGREWNELPTFLETTRVHQHKQTRFVSPPHRENE